MATEQFETVIIGGGQAGLAVGYYLAQQRRSFVILDANERVGDAWRKRWDSLRLFTPARYNGLPGLRFPGRGWYFPTKDEMADYLEGYAERFALPVRTGIKVDDVSKNGDRYLVRSGDLKIEADNVVVASGAHHIPKVPAFGAELDPQIVQLHSSAYLKPSQLQAGGVLIVGIGNSGAEIAHEVSKTHRTSVSGKPTPEIPVKHGSVPARFVLPIIRFAGTHVLTVKTPMGRKFKPTFVSHGAPLIRTKMKDLIGAGVEQVPRTVGAREGRPLTNDGRVLEVSNVIWCTGYRPDYGWIDLPIFDEEGRPLHDRGVVRDAPGVYFIGLMFQYAAVSDVLPGVGRDAKYVVKHIAARAHNGKAAASTIAVA